MRGWRFPAENGTQVGGGGGGRRGGERGGERLRERGRGTAVPVGDVEQARVEEERYLPLLPGRGVEGVRAS